MFLSIYYHTQTHITYLIVFCTHTFDHELRIEYENEREKCIIEGGVSIVEPLADNV